MPPRRKNEASSDHKDLSFEDAMTELENIVEAMEGEELPLEELIARYETGAHLLKHCNAVLTNARKRIELITLSDRASKSDATSSPLSNKSLEPKSIDPEEDNDITLF
jgi:exodeoxyribonuclease VII small subunit